jgi:DNA-binding transcriptional MerR regulator
VAIEAFHQPPDADSGRTRASRLLLRYYEEEGLFSPSRSPNGYRDHDERFLDRVAQIRGLLDAGLPIRVIKRLLPGLDTPWTIYCPEMIATRSPRTWRPL